MRRVLTAGAVRQWRPRLEEVFRSERQYGVAVSGGVEHVGLRAKIHHQAGHWVIAMDFSNAFNSVSRKSIFEELPKRAPGLAPFVAKCYGDQSAEIAFTMEAGDPTR